MKNKDELLFALGDSLRDPNPLDDERLERLAAGELTDEELNDYLESMGDDEEARQMVLAMSPVSESLADNLISMVEQTEVTAKISQQDTELKSKVVSIDERRSEAKSKVTTFLKIGVPVAIAAAALFVFFPFTSGTTYKPLPKYGLEFQGGEKSVRSATTVKEGTILKLTDSSRLTVRLRPSTKVDGKVSVSAFLFDESGQMKKVLDNISVKTSKSGTVTIAGQAKDIFGETQKGSAQMALVLGRPGLNLGNFDTLKELEENLEGEVAQIFVQPLELLSK